MLKRFTSLALSVLLVSPAAGWGQTSSIPLEDVRKDKSETPTEEKKPATPTDDKKVERIEVTGSHIRRIDGEGAAPVKTITRKEIEKTGYNSVADVLRDTTVNSFGGGKESSGSSTAGNAEVSLRGLGSQNTLVLLNGHRLPTDAVTGAVDLNLVPMAAVERVEILKDGASAVYGSDAVGGVVNIITRKDFSGSEINLTQTTPEQKGGGRKDISLVNGINREKWNMVNVIQYRDNDTVYSRDRSWTSQGRSQTGNPGTYSSDGDEKVHADPACPANQVQHTPDGDYCLFKYSDYATELPSIEQFSLLSETNTQVSSRVKWTNRIGGTDRTVKWSFAPSPDTVIIPASVADRIDNGHPLPEAIPGQDLQVMYRTTDLGTRDSVIKSQSYNILEGANVELPRDWNMDVSVSHNAVNSVERGVNGYALKSEVRDQITTGQCNPFLQGSCESLDQARYVPVHQMRSQLSSLEVRGSGPIAELSSGPLGLAIGGDTTFQKYDDVFDLQSSRNNVYGGAGSSGHGQRSTRAVFSELSVPLTRKVELSLAGRYDHFSDFGDTVNPKIGLGYRPTKSVLLRTSASTGFRAPLMQDLYASKSNGYPTFIDHVACEREKKAGGGTPSCEPQQYLVTSGGNEGLKAQKSVSYTAGGVWQPTNDFSFGSDTFYSKMRDVVGLSLEDATEAEQKFGSKYINDRGIFIPRKSNGSRTRDPIIATQQNLASVEIMGIDLDTSYRLRKFKLSSEHSQMFYYREEGFPGLGMRNKLGDAGRPIWRNSTALSFIPNEKNAVSLIAGTTASQRKEVPEAGNIKQYTTWGLEYAYNTKRIGTFSVAVRNVLGSTPPIDDSAPTAPLNTSLYDQVGRQLFTGYKATF
jgi:iron complex outermembrane receptor protein